MNIQKRILDLNAARESAGRELQLEINAAQGKFQEQLLAVVAQFGRDEGFTLIFEKGLVVWASETIDVTTSIVDRFNAMVPAAAPAEGGSDGQ
jgi:Skp family chaperone for outer membrane proteins